MRFIERVRAFLTGETFFRGEVQKLKVEPGEVLVLSVPGYVNDNTAALLKSSPESELKGTKCLVLDGGMTLSALQLPNFEVEVLQVIEKRERIRASASSHSGFSRTDILRRG